MAMNPIDPAEPSKNVVVRRKTWQFKDDADVKDIARRAWSAANEFVDRAGFVLAAIDPVLSATTFEAWWCERMPMPQNECPVCGHGDGAHDELSHRVNADYTGG
jgi:hypothetical protein